MLVAGLAVVGAALLTALPTRADTPGTGGVYADRFPWLEGARRQLTQGWFGHESHVYQFGEDWTARDGQSTPVPFTVRAVAEGDATCHNNTGDGSGEWISVPRSTAGITWNWTDYYFHLDNDTCGPGGWTKHVEQGDVLAVATGTGSNLIHLHFEPRDPGGHHHNSVFHWDSGITNFCDHDDGPAEDPPNGNPNHDGEPNYTCRQAHDNQWYVSDNAGPGLGDGLNPWGAGAIWLAYSAKGDYLCGGSAWDCFGSSFSILGEGRKATRSCLGSSNDCGWHQDFKEQASSGAEPHDFNWPESCGVAYWIPDQFFIAWLNNTWLGQARSSVYFDVSAIGAGYFQDFRHGWLVSATFGGPAAYIAGSNTTCKP